MTADFGKIIDQSVKITFKNKWLWVFGLVLVTMSSGGSNFSNFSNYANKSDSKDAIEKNNSDKKQNQPESNDENTIIPRTTNKQLETKLAANIEITETNEFGDLPKVLGQAVISGKQILASIPIAYWVIMVIAILIAIVISIAIALYAYSWAYGSLIFGIDQESKNISETLKTMSENGKNNAVELIKLSLIPGLILFSIFIVGAVPLGLLSLLAKDSPTQLTLYLLILGIFIIIYLISTILVSVSVMLGGIALVLEKLTWTTALKKGFTVFTKYFLEVIIMGVINCCISVILIGALMVVMIPLVVAGAAAIVGAAAFPPILGILVPLATLGFIAFILGSSLVSAILKVFQYSTWVLLYKQLTQEVKDAN